ncbi:hypothetical protein ABPG77_003953 [Micractinium sp. CCAP 211/92]
MMTATTLSTNPVAASGAQRRRPAQRALCVRVSAKASAAALADSTLQSDHWSGGSPLILPNGTVTHSATQEQLEVVSSLQPMFEEHILPLLTPVEELWQPTDFLPDPRDQEQFFHEVSELRERAQELPDELFVCLVGDMITEEALPTYMAMLNTLDGVRDETGRSMHPYAQWTRQWIAEENRHGDVLGRYLYLSGRVDMKQVERTVQRLISVGMDPRSENHPYLAFVFTSFQERATKVSHGGTARIAKQCGDEQLAKMCGLIAADESRHEAAYTRTMDAIFKADPNGAMLAFADMMRKQIVMPAHLMDDGRHAGMNSGRNLFEDFSEVAEGAGVYTAIDYCKIMEHLIQRWRVADLTGLNPKAAEAQEFVCNLPARIRRLAERKAVRKEKAKKNLVKFSWLYDRALAI